MIEEEVAVEHGGRLILINTASVDIVYIESEACSLIGVHSQISLETLFTVSAAAMLKVAKVSERRFGIGVYHIIRMHYSIVVRIEKKERAGFFSVEEDMRKARSTQVAKIRIVTQQASGIISILEVMLKRIHRNLRDVSEALVYHPRA